MEGREMMDIDNAITRAFNELGVVSTREGAKNLKSGLMGVNGGCDVASFNRLIGELKANKGSGYEK